MNRRFRKLFFSLLSSVLILLNSFSPFLSVAIKESYASEDSIPVSEAIESLNVNPAEPLAVTEAPTPLPTEDLMVISTPTVAPEETVVPTMAPLLEEIGAQTEIVVVDEVSAQPTPTPTPEPVWRSSEDGSYVTFNDIVLNQEYFAPQNDKVRVEFSRLPENPGKLTIKEVKLSAEDVTRLGALSDTAYDITSDMTDGTFTYDLALPNPKPSEDVDVKYTQDGESFTEVEAQEQSDIVVIKNLDHFTLFVVTSSSDFSAGTSSGVTIDLSGSVSNTLGSETSDQTQTTGTNSQTFNDTTWLSQTFTAGTTGFLSKVTLSLDRNNQSDTTGGVTVEIRNTSSGAPSGSAIGSVAVSSSTISQNTQTNYDFTFASQSISVDSGTVYAIVVYRSNTGGDTSNYTWYRSNSNSYSGGTRYRSTNSGSSWTSSTTDERFTTYIQAYSGTGTIASDVLDTNYTTTTFSSLSWTENLPSGADITFEVRASNILFAVADASPAWISLGSSNSSINLSIGLPSTYQYFQWRATLTGTGNATPTLNDVTVTYNRPPTITLTSPNGSEMYAGSSSQNITWSTSDADAGDTLTIDLEYSTDGGTSYSPIASGLADSGTYAWTVPNLDTATVIVRATVSDGTTTANDISDADLLVDSTWPTDPSGLSSTTPTDGTPVNDPNVTIDWSVSGSDALSGVDGYSYDFTGGATDTPDAVKDIEESVTSISEILADGTWYFHLRTVDNAGNWTATTHLGPFIVDTTAPTGTVTLGTAVVKNSDLVQEVTVTYDEVMNTGTTPAIDFATTSGGWGSNGDGAWDGTGQIWTESFTLIDVNEDVSGVVVSSSGAEDLAVNPEGASVTASFGVDDQEPTVTVVSLVTGDNTPALSGTIDDTSAPTISLTINGGSYNATNNGDGTWSLADNTVVTLSDGTYEVSVAAVDTNGNLGFDTSTLEVEVDTVFPTVGTITVVTDYLSTYVRGNSFTIRASVSDSATGIDSTSCEYTTDGGATWSAASYVSPRCRVTGVTAADGASLTINMRVKDLAGNQTTGSAISRTADAASPVLGSLTISPDYSSTYTSSTPTVTATFTDTVSAISDCDYRYRITGSGSAGWSAWTTVDNNTGTTSAVCDVTIPGATLTDNTQYDFQVRASDSTAHTTNSGATALQRTIDATPPLVDAGSDQTVNVATFQDATVDASIAGAATYAWSQASGSGTVTFTPNGGEDTTLSADTDDVYTIQLMVTDNVGQVTSDLMQLTWDQTLPSATVSAYLPDPTNVNTPTYTGTASDNLSGVVNVEYRVDGGSWQAATAVDGAFDGTSEAYTFTTGALSDGTHTIEVRATDAAGSVQTSYASDTLTIDTVKPTGVITLGTATLFDGDLVQEVTVTYDEAMDPSSNPGIAFGATIGSISSNGDGAWGSGNTVWTETFTLIDANETTSGVAVNSSVATDLAGNVENGSSNSFDIDTQNPVLSSVSIASDNTNPIYAKVGDTATVTFTTSESTTTPTVIIDGNSASVSGGPTSWTAAYTFTGSESEGTIPFTIDFSDLIGNVGTQVTTTTDASSVIFDMSNPAVAGDNDSSSWYTANITITLSVSDTGGSLLNTARYNWDSAADATTGTLFSDADTLSIPSDGSHILYLYADDGAGNSSTWSGIYKLDTINPTTSATGSSSSWTNVLPSIVVSASDTLPGSDVALVKYAWDALGSTGTLTSDGADISSSLTEGDHVLNLYVEDNAGRSGTWSGPYRYDVTAPSNPSTLGSSSHTASVWSSDNTVDISWSGASDNLSGVAGYSYSWDTNATTDPDTISEGSTTSTTSASLSESNSHYFHLRTLDTAGNWTSTSLHLGPFFVDTVKPSKPTAQPGAGDYSGAQSVLFSSTDEISGVLDIYYTVDGSTPTTNGLHFSPGLAVSVDKDLTLKVIAYDRAGNGSDVLEAVYGIAPTISSMGASVLSTSTATVSWTTNNAASSRVIYDTVSHSGLGSAPNYGYANSTSESDTNSKVTSHGVSLSGLSASTTYYYRVVSKASPEAVSGEQSFTTSAVVLGVATGTGSEGEVAGAETSTSPTITSNPEQDLSTPSTESESGEIAGESTTRQPFDWSIFLLFGGPFFLFLLFLYRRKRS